MDVNEIFGDFEDNHETKISTKQGNVATKNNINNNVQKNRAEQSVFDPFNNNQVHKNQNEINWMLDVNNNPKNNSNNNNINDMKNNNFFNFDFVDSGSSNTNNSPSKSNNNFNDIHNIFSMPGSTNNNVADNTNSSKGFNFNQQNVNSFAEFKFEVNSVPHQAKSTHSAHSGFNLIDMNSTNGRSKSPNVNDTINNCFPHGGHNNQFNMVNNNNNMLGNNLNMNNNNKSKSPNPSHLPSKNHNQPQDIYDFFK